jgi:hypothetical protein
MGDSNVIAQIGRCIGCSRTGRLDDGVCGACLTGRGRQWAEMSNRIRTDPVFALGVYCEITNEHAREMFVKLFGRPWLPESEKAVASLRRLMARVGWRPASELTVVAAEGVDGDDSRGSHGRSTRGREGG